MSLGLLSQYTYDWFNVTVYPHLVMRYLTNVCRYVLHEVIFRAGYLSFDLKFFS